MSSAAAMPGTPPEDLRAKRRMALIGGSLGNLVEWYDWFIYASFAIYFADSFFPGDRHPGRACSQRHRDQSRGVSRTSC